MFAIHSQLEFGKYLNSWVRLCPMHFQSLSYVMPGCEIVVHLILPFTDRQWVNAIRSTIVLIK
jgi:hypothetical protein